MTSPPPNAPTILITGAAGGLGQALTSEFLRQGWRVAAGWHQTPLPRPTHPTQFLPLPLDVTNSTQIHNAVRVILECWNSLDVLINNAGLILDHLLWRLAPAHFDHLLDVNLNGARRCSQAVLPHMIARHNGHILNIGSFSARSGSPGQSAYAAAKAGLIGLTHSLAREAGQHNIRCNVILPGILPTPMTSSLSPDTLRAFSHANCLGRLSDLAEVASFTAFLATTRNVSGQCFQLDSRIAAWT
jgi:3-oxoacyl-[acyl-carrier protein] reductase